MYIPKGHTLFQEKLTTIGQHWEYPNKIIGLQNFRQPSKMIKSLIWWKIPGWQLTFPQEHSMTKDTGAEQFESRIFKYKGHSFDPARIQGLLFT